MNGINKRNKKHFVVLLLISSLLLTGCWDREDIERRAYILGVAIDVYPPVPQGGEKAEDEETTQNEEKFMYQPIHTGVPTYAMTVQIPIIRKSTMLNIGEVRGAGEGKNYWNLTSIGNTFSEMTEDISSRMDYIPYYGNLVSIVVSEEIAKQGLCNVLDFFIRFREMRRRTKLFVSVGEARRIFDVVPRITDFPALYLTQLPEANKANNPGTVHMTDLSEALKYIQTGLDFVLPRIDCTKEEILDRGAAVIKGDRLTGWIDAIELSYVKLVQGIYKGGVITTECPEKSGEIIAIKLVKAKTTIKPDVSRKTVKFTVTIKAEADIVEFLYRQNLFPMSPEYRSKLEGAFEEHIREHSLKVVKKMQKEFKADVFHFCEVLRAKEPEYWEKIKEKWDEVYEDAEVEIVVDLLIKSSSSIR